MAHTTTLRAHGAACASDARLRRPCSSRASRYFISPACPPAIQRGKDSSSGEFSTGAMPTSSKPASLAARVTLVVISADRSTAAPNKSDSSRTITAKPVPIWNSNLELRFTFKLRNHSPALDQRISFSSQSHATLKLRVLRICFPGDKLYAANLPPNGIPFCSQITDDPNHNLAAGASCVLGVTFKPTTTGVVTDSFGIDMMCDLPCQGQVFTLPLVGTGGSGPVLIFKPNPMVFPNPVPAGTISTDKIIVTVTNTGNAAATISGMPGAPGTPVTAFHLDTSTCYQGLPAPLPAPAAYPTCTMTFSFRPP